MRVLKLIFYICCNPGIEIFNKFPVQHSSAHLHTDSCSNFLCTAIEISVISRLVSELAHRGFLGVFNEQVGTPSAGTGRPCGLAMKRVPDWTEQSCGRKSLEWVFYSKSVVYPVV